MADATKQLKEKKMPGMRPRVHLPRLLGLQENLRGPCDELLLLVLPEKSRGGGRTEEKKVNLLKLKPFLCFACFPKDEMRTASITVVMARVPKWLMFLCWVFRKRESEQKE